jgi:hypothetical protein
VGADCKEGDFFRGNAVKIQTRALGLSAALAVAQLFVFSNRAQAALFTPGDLVVSTYGTSGSSTGDQAPTPISLIEYSTNGGALILSDTLPTTDGVGGSANDGVVGEYGSNSEGNIQLSGNGQYLTLAGYSASAAAAGINASTNTANSTHFAIGTAFGPSTVSLAQSTDSNVPRLAIMVDANGNVNSSTVLNDLYNTNNPRAVYSANGSSFYISGQGDGGTSNQGIFFGPTGLNTVTTSNTPTPIYTAKNTRFVTGYNGNLFFSLDTSLTSFPGIYEYTGMPTSAATPTKIIPGNNGLSGSSEVFYSPEGFYFANPDTLYVADTGNPKAGNLGDGGIQKWTFNGSTWSLQYTLTPTGGTWVPAASTASASSGQSGFAAITGEVVGSGASATVELFAVSYTLGDDNPNGLYKIADTLDATTGSGETFTEIESAPGNGRLNFKGVSFAPTSVPEPTSLTLVCLGGLALLRRRKHAGPR